jgi:hypothetical protein
MTRIRCNNALYFCYNAVTQYNRYATQIMMSPEEIKKGDALFEKLKNASENYISYVITDHPDYKQIIDLEQEKTVVDEKEGRAGLEAVTKVYNAQVKVKASNTKLTKIKTEVAAAKTKVIAAELEVQTAIKALETAVKVLEAARKAELDAELDAKLSKNLATEAMAAATELVKRLNDS